MEDTKLINWEFIEDNKMVGTLDIFYILLRKTNNPKPYELRIFRHGDIWLFLSFDNLTAAVTFAQEIITKYYGLKEVIKKTDNNVKSNIVYIKEWRESHGSKK